MLSIKDNLIVKVHTTSKDAGKTATDDVTNRINELLSQKATINMIFGAAPSQLDFLSALVVANGVDWSRINAFHMDEYIGLTRDAPQRFGNFLKANLFDKISFRQVFYLDGLEPADKECERYTHLLLEYPPDYICMGIGENGHIAFSDPHVADFNDYKYVKVVDLDTVCRQQQVNDNCFERIEEVPTHALTLTIPVLMSAPYIYCVVPFRSKAQAVYSAINGNISTLCPASVLRTKENAILYLDKESASLLKMSDY